MRTYTPPNKRQASTVVYQLGGSHPHEHDERYYTKDDSSVGENSARSSQEIAKHTFGEQGETITYNGSNQISQIVYADGSTRTFTYNGSNQVETSVHVYKGKTVTYTYSYTWGLLTSVSIS